jgi:hypothetical protein
VYMIPELCSPISVRPRSRMVRCLKVRIRCLQCHAPPPGTQSTCAKWMPGSADDSTSTMSFSHVDECLQCLQYGERCLVHLRCRVSSSTLAARIERAHQKLFETVCSKSLPVSTRSLAFLIAPGAATATSEIEVKSRKVRAA